MFVLILTFDPDMVVCVCVCVGMSVKMNEVKEMMLLVVEKQQRFRQQQFTFITALERSREHARHQTQPVSTVTEVQWYMTHHCSNATDKRIFLLFLEVIDDLKTLFQKMDLLASAINHSSEVLDTCRNVLSLDCDFSQFQAHYPHDEVNRLSCNEARNFYGGVVSVIPMTLDLLKIAISDLVQASKETNPQLEFIVPQMTTASVSSENTSMNANADSHMSTGSSKPVCKVGNGWKPAWKPPGGRRV